MNTTAAAVAATAAEKVLDLFAVATLIGFYIVLMCRTLRRSATHANSNYKISNEYFERIVYVFVLFPSSSSFFEMLQVILLNS